MSAAAGDKVDLNIGIAEVRMPVDGIEVNLGPRIVMAMGTESIIVTPDVARQIAARLLNLAHESEQAAS